MTDPAAAQVDDLRRVLTEWPAPGDTQEQLRVRYLSFLATHAAAAVTRSLRVGHVTASTLLLDHRRERVLLTLHPLAGRWFQLGGHVEPGDASVADAALREATEESGMSGLRLDPVPIGLDWHPTRCRDGSGQPGPSSHLDVEHVAIAPQGARPRRSSESLDLAWFPLDALPEGADAVVRRLVRRARVSDFARPRGPGRAAAGSSGRPPAPR